MQVIQEAVKSSEIEEEIIEEENSVEETLKISSEEEQKIDDPALLDIARTEKAMEDAGQETAQYDNEAANDNVTDEDQARDNAERSAEGVSRDIQKVHDTTDNAHKTARMVDAHEQKKQGLDANANQTVISKTSSEAPTSQIDPRSDSISVEVMETDLPLESPGMNKPEMNSPDIDSAKNLGTLTTQAPSSVKRFESKANVHEGTQASNNSANTDKITSIPKEESKPHIALAKLVRSNSSNAARDESDNRNVLELPIDPPSSPQSSHTKDLSSFSVDSASKPVTSSVDTGILERVDESTQSQLKPLNNMKTVHTEAMRDAFKSHARSPKESNEGRMDSNQRRESVLEKDGNKGSDGSEGRKGNGETSNEEATIKNTDAVGVKGAGQEAVAVVSSDKHKDVTNARVRRIENIKSNVTSATLTSALHGKGADSGASSRDGPVVLREKASLLDNQTQTFKGDNSATVSSPHSTTTTTTATATSNNHN